MLKNKFSIYFCFMETMNQSSFVNYHYGIFQQLYCSF
ncbi:glycogen/starch/alpha-glucan phosphorylase [Leptospira noguchii]|nr:glycogen/starch/alpha-glucan phosphorylase [Leptospira noguchii]